MKKILLSCALIAGTLGATAQQKANALKANIFSPIVKTGSFFFERKLNEKSSAQLGVGFTSFKKDDVTISGLFFTPEYRFYLSGEAMNGFYVAPFLRYQNLTLENKSTTNPGKATLNTYGGGVVAGRQWLFGNIVTLDTYVGPSLNSGSAKVVSGTNPKAPATFSGFGIRFGLTLGIAF